MIRKTPLQRKPLKRPTRGLNASRTRVSIKKVSKPKKLSRKALWGAYGLEVPKYIRYSGLQGILWWLVSKYVRMTEFKKYGGYCVDGCGRKVESWQDADCGHFRSAKSLNTRFLRTNLGLQTKQCNSPRGGNGNQYAFGRVIDHRYGEGKADWLTELSKKTAEPMKKDFLDAEIRHYKILVDKLENTTNEGLL